MDLAGVCVVNEDETKTDCGVVDTITKFTNTEPLVPNDSDAYTQSITLSSDVLWGLRHPDFITNRCTVAVTDITDPRLAVIDARKIYDHGEIGTVWTNRLDAIAKIDVDGTSKNSNTILRVPVGAKFAFDAERVLEVHKGLVFAWCQIGGGNITMAVWVLVATRVKVSKSKSDTTASKFFNALCDLFGDGTNNANDKTPSFDTRMLYATCQHKHLLWDMYYGAR